MLDTLWCGLGGTVPMARSYQKPWLSYRDQCNLLSSRGLEVTDASFATEVLRHVQYYRFSGYCLAFETSRHVFLPGTRFEDVVAAYEFDRHLRRLLSTALEWIEIDFRTAVAHEFAGIYGPFGHLHSRNFFPKFSHPEWIEQCRKSAEKSRERFVEHYREEYDGFPDLPIWVVTELLSFGDVSRLYKGLLRKDQTKIAGKYARQPHELISWMHHLVYMRNVCAHFARVWDRVHAVTPIRPHAIVWNSHVIPDSSRLFMTMLVLAAMLNQIPLLGPKVATWRQQIEHYIENKRPRLSHANELMGLTDDWNNHPVWQAAHKTPTPRSPDHGQE